jgi:hypothetical protein
VIPIVAGAVAPPKVRKEYVKSVLSGSGSAPAARLGRRRLRYRVMFAPHLDALRAAITAGRSWPRPRALTRPNGQRSLASKRYSRRAAYMHTSNLPATTLEPLRNRRIKRLA